VWDDAKNSLLWIDVEGKKLWIYEYENKIHRSIDLEERPGAFTLLDTGLAVLVALERRLVRVDLVSGKAETVLNFDRNVTLPTARPNDGRVDRQGQRLLLGLNQTVWAPARRGDARQRGDATGLFSVGGTAGTAAGGKGKIAFESLLETPLPCLDGLAFDSKGTTMYLCVAARREIHAFGYHPATGALSGRRLFHRLRPEERGFPSGAACDAQDHLWSCRCVAGQVVRHAPGTGAVTLVVDLPVANPTALAFGGPGLADLFVITSRVDDALPQDAAAAAHHAPSAGGLFHARLGSGPGGLRGLPEPRLRPDTALALAARSSEDQCTLS